MTKNYFRQKIPNGKAEQVAFNDSHAREARSYLISNCFFVINEGITDNAASCLVNKWNKSTSLFKYWI